MSHGTCETVKVNDDSGGYIVINKSDLMADHTLYDGGECYEVFAAEEKPKRGRKPGPKPKGDK